MDYKQHERQEEHKKRKQAIEALLDHWNDYFEPSPSGISDGDGTGVVFVSGMSRWPAVVELVRVVGLTRDMLPVHYKHFAGKYRSEWRTVNVPVKRRDAKGRWVADMARQRQRVIPSWVNLRLADQAVNFQLGAWNDDVAMELPPAMNRKLVELTDSAGTHLTEARRVA